MKTTSLILAAEHPARFAEIDVNGRILSCIEHGAEQLRARDSVIRIATHNAFWDPAQVPRVRSTQIQLYRTIGAVQLRLTSIDQSGHVWRSNAFSLQTLLLALDYAEQACCGGHPPMEPIFGLPSQADRRRCIAVDSDGGETLMEDYRAIAPNGPSYSDLEIADRLALA